MWEILTDADRAMRIEAHSCQRWRDGLSDHSLPHRVGPVWSGDGFLLYHVVIIGFSKVGWVDPFVPAASGRDDLSSDLHIEVDMNRRSGKHRDGLTGISTHRVAVGVVIQAAAGDAVGTRRNLDGVAALPASRGVVADPRGDVRQCYEAPNANIGIARRPSDLNDLAVNVAKRTRRDTDPRYSFGPHARADHQEQRKNPPGDDLHWCQYRAGRRVKVDQGRRPAGSRSRSAAQDRPAFAARPPDARPIFRWRGYASPMSRRR